MVTQRRLKEVLNYNPETGVFNWVNRKQKVAGYIKINGYRGITVDNKTYAAHTLAWIYVYNKVPSMLDHIDHNRDNNAILNLREVDCTTNSKNMKQNKNNKTGIVGVSWNNKLMKWAADITVNRRTVKLGCFTDIYLAIKARADAEIKYNFHPSHGENCINWDYINKMQLFVNHSKKGDANKVKVAQLSREGEVIKEFNSAKEAGEELNIQRSHIGSVCKGNRKTAGGFKWKYL